MGFLHQLAVECTGVGGRQFLKRCVGLNPRPQAFKDYRRIITDYSKKMNKTACTKIDIVKTFEEVAASHGFQRETLETLQSVEFLEQFHKFLATKGYKLPKSLTFMEYRLPSGSGLAGETLGKHIIYNPRCLKTLDFRVPIHEEGHLLRGFGILKMMKDVHLHSFGEFVQSMHGKIIDNPITRLFSKNKAARKAPINIWGGHRKLCHLSFKEQDILFKDLERAYKEGFFTHNPVGESRKELLRLFGTTPQERAEMSSHLNRVSRDFRKNPAKYYLPNMQFNRAEFIADYFHLAVRGFKFSPEITAKYIKYGGPEIKGIVTKEELQMLEDLRKSIGKKTLADYGYTMSV